MTRAQLVLSVYDHEVYLLYGALGIYQSQVERSNLRAADYWAGVVRRRAAAVEATIAEFTPEASE